MGEAAAVEAKGGGREPGREGKFSSFSSTPGSLSEVRWGFGWRRQRGTRDEEGGGVPGCGWANVSVSERALDPGRGQRCFGKVLFHSLPIQERQENKTKAKIERRTQNNLGTEFARPILVQHLLLSGSCVNFAAGSRGLTQGPTRNSPSLPISS